MWFKRKFQITFVYSLNKSFERIPFWESLSQIALGIAGPCCVIGDFSAILSPYDRIHRNELVVNELSEFADCINACGLAWKVLEHSIPRPTRQCG